MAPLRAGHGPPERTMLKGGMKRLSGEESKENESA
jgi:hypothetical protein